ncbi:uncharacterized protein SPPG_02841 [Spizellomyces punctatus DAOM BR117]|uniref:Uncharacterized protein n=1 Tax=Spizellomyces punctatus (strain DAOM BR117) TaxID=645134 RepID=A0A0L0HLR5_SPIPD|nr:uncharacterized protein SPPG_02841 [Spizellomyces punctatus DAOM BR117]KND02371.1 hypothetical protein SPPG_02841 [Spizellomyces punctatus DAOM BR117]|eukprot:XP_016610410.1 hypothetical protein SPPG_02841 [Spizellomyces punctatus DAOM BR117]
MLRAWNDWKVKANDVPAPSKPSTPSYASSAATPSSVLPDTRTSAPSSARVLVIKNNASKQRFSRGGWGSNSLRNPTEKQETVWERVARNIHERDQAAGSNLLDDAEKQTPVTFAHLASGGQQQQQGSSSDSESKPSIAPPPRPSFATTASQPNRPHSRAVGGVGARIANKDEFPGLPTRAPRPALSRPINGRIGGQAWGSESEDGQSGEKNEERGRKGKKGKTVLMHFG